MKQKKLLAAGLCILLGLTGCQTAAPAGEIGPGTGTVAEGWIDEAIDFWQAQV